MEVFLSVLPNGQTAAMHVQQQIEENWDLEELLEYHRKVTTLPHEWRSYGYGETEK